MDELANFERKQFPAGTAIFEEGENGTSAFVVETGLVEIAKTTARGDKILGYVGAGGSFGEMALIDGKPRMARAVAIKDTICRVISAEEFEARMAGTHPVVKMMLASLASDVRAVAEKPAVWADWF